MFFYLIVINLIFLSANAHYSFLPIIPVLPIKTVLPIKSVLPIIPVVIVWIVYTILVLVVPT